MSVEEARKKKKKKMQKRFIFRSAILGVLILTIVYVLYTNFMKDNELYKQGDPAPDFELTQINDRNDIETIRMSDLKGKGVMLNFWATYCEPCKAEMPFMESLYPEYKDDIEIVAVSLDYNDLVIREFVDEFDLTFPIVHDTKSDVLDLYKIKPLPSTLFIDPDGYIVEKVEGALTLDNLESHFKEIQP